MDLSSTIKHHDWIPVRSPGIKWYADEILAGRTFSFIRYGEGEWKFSVPAIPEKTRGRHAFWKLKEAQDALRHTLLHCHNADRYFPAMFHQLHLRSRNQWHHLKDWIEKNDLGWIRWHYGRIWRISTENDQMHIIISAIRQQKLPVIVVGPKRIGLTAKKLRAEKFIQIKPEGAYWDRAEIEKQILDLGKPALVSFSAGPVTKMLIHSLWPKIGKHTFMIDFGAVWDGLCGNPRRLYHHSLDDRRKRLNWEGHE